MVCNKMGQWLMVALGCLYGHINFRVNAIKKEGDVFFCFLFTLSLLLIYLLAPTAR
jgi:hypothetical protein